VTQVEEAVVAWAALSPASSRPVYSGVAWESVYVAGTERGRGVGRRLLEHLIPASETAGVWTLMAGIQAENEASLRLHLAVGFGEVGRHRRLARDPGGRWRDVVVMERRSEAIGRG
jgi:L-amino acid N-acyltransferase YncA